MKRFFLIGFLVLMAFDTLCQMSFKFAAIGMGPASLELGWLQQAFVQKWLYCAGLGYLGSFVTYMTLLKHAPVGPAFAASHLEIVSVTILSVFLLGESLSLVQAAGAVLIVSGILVLAYGERNGKEHNNTTSGDSAHLGA